jgi:cell division septum initiation protein DivIVA
MDITPRRKESDPYEQVRKDLAARDTLSAELQGLRRQIAEQHLLLAVPEAETKLAELTSKIATAQAEAVEIRAAADRDASSIRGRATLDAQAAIEAANGKAAEIVTAAERRGGEIVEEARRQRERDLEVSNSRIHNIESSAIAEMERVQKIHAEQLALEAAYLQQRKTLLEKAR